MVNELKPCPFCGSENIEITSYCADLVFIQCDGCGATFPHFDSEKEAIKAWNGRVDNAEN